MSGIGAYRISVDGGPSTALDLQGNATVTLAPGPHKIRLHAIDVAGNSATNETAIVVDTNPFSFTGPYHGIPTIALVVVSASVAVVAVLLSLRKRKLIPPHQP